jgi:hypothetical protein
MRKIFLAVLILSTNSFASQISYVGGLPDQSVDFVKNIIDMKMDFISGAEAETDWTTGVYSIFAKHGIRNADQLVVNRSDGSAVEDEILQAMQQAAYFSPVVFVDSGPETHDMCTLMWVFSNNVFVLPSGRSGTEVPIENPVCEERNIIRVAALNKDRSALANFSNYGALSVSIAAKGEDVSVTMSGGKEVNASSTTVAAAAVAAELAKFNEANPEFLEKNGANAVVEAFFYEATEPMTGLSDKIRDGRKLKAALDP